MNQPPSVTALAFRTLPHQPGTFLEYLDWSPRAAAFYRRPPALSSVRETAEEKRGTASPRTEMAEILKEQNQSYGCCKATLRAIENLSRPGSVAVLTGQQIGFFAGPVLAVYKALTAVRLSDELRREGFNAVPVFWMASDDHDLAEITRIPVTDTGGSVRSFDFRETLFGARDLPPRPVGDIAIPEAVGEVISRYLDSLAGNRISEARSQIAAAYRPGISLADAFGQLMSRLFAGRGLVIFNPRARVAKQLALPVFERALADARALQALLAARSKDLIAAGLQPQVSSAPHATLVFLESDQQRRLLETGAGSTVTVKQTGRRYAASELQALLHAAPERFSPNVLLRPILQDHLFPTVAYVGGPAEISYFAQVEPLYRHFNSPMPVVWPRGSFTVLLAETGSIMDRYGLSLEDCFQGKMHSAKRALQTLHGRPEELLTRMERNIDECLEEWGSMARQVNPSLKPAADTARRKLLHRTRSLKTKFANFELRRNHALNEDLEKLWNGAFPEGDLQERVIGVHYLLSRLGPSLMDAVYDAIDIHSFTHKILRFG